jgi:hypothetical protein
VLPGLGIWVERSSDNKEANGWLVVEEPLESAASLLSHVAGQTRVQADDTALVKLLYQRAVSQKASEITPSPNAS